MTHEHFTGPRALRVLLLLLLGGLHTHAQFYGEVTDHPPDGPAGGGGGGDDGGAFFALRSCHQLLRGERGEFFSPDFLCSNPPLWCNWTIRVDPGRQIQLHLEDLTPYDDCHLKQDQIHVDEPAGGAGAHRVLQRCWQEAHFASSSDTLHVVLLIPGRPGRRYRGFYGRYRAFGPQEVPELPDYEAVLSGEVVEDPSLAGSEPEEDYYDPPGERVEGTWAEVEEEDDHTASDNHQTSTPPPPPSSTVPPLTLRTSRSERGAAHTPRSDLATPPALPPNTEAASPPEEELIGVGSGPAAEVVTDASDSRPPTPDSPQTHPDPIDMEPLSDRRHHSNLRNQSTMSHLPGDHLFEVAVELTFTRATEASHELAEALMASVKSLISKQLAALPVQLAMTPKRIKRLKAGVLYILWLNAGQGRDPSHIYRSIHSGLEGLLGTGIALSGHDQQAVVVSVSAGDVNECGTHLMLCDVHADCVNQFGSYACRCRPGFHDKSRLGPGGTVCVDASSSGCKSSISTETKAVYVLFFLLCFLVAALLLASCLLYRRRHRGAFPVRCRRSVSPPDSNNNAQCFHDDADLPPPPPPPSRGWSQGKEPRPQVDLQLLRFSSLLAPPEGGKT